MSASDIDAQIRDGMLELEKNDLRYRYLRTDATQVKGADGQWHIVGNPEQFDAIVDRAVESAGFK